MEKIVSEDQVIDLSMNIIKDSKRRWLYFDAKNKKGYQIKTSDFSWIKIYNMRFVIATMVFMLLQLVIDPLISLIVAIVVYLAIQILFERVFLDKKLPFKVHENDLAKLEDKAVLKQKRDLEMYKVVFVLLLGGLEITKTIGVDVDLWRKVLIVVVFVVMLGFRLNILWAYHKKFKSV